MTKLFGSWRLGISIFGLFANILGLWMRLNLSMAVVCMTGTEDGTLQSEFDWDKDTIALILSGYFYGYVSTQILAGYIVEKYGGKWPLLFGVFSSATSMLFMPLLVRWHWSALLAARIFQGIHVHWWGRGGNPSLPW